jgi:hypothetical protein
VTRRAVGWFGIRFREEVISRVELATSASTNRTALTWAVTQLNDPNNMAVNGNKTKRNPMRIITLRSKVKKESLANFEVAIEKMISAINQEGPKGVRFTSCRLPDSETFVALLELEEAVDNPLPGIAAAEEFRENLKNWVVEPPIREELEVVGYYRSSR